MVTNQKIKKTLDEIKQITQKEVLLYSSKAKYVSGTDEAKEDYAILAERLIVSEEEYIIEESCAAFAAQIHPHRRSDTEFQSRDRAPPRSAAAFRSCRACRRRHNRYTSALLPSARHIHAA